MNREELLQRIDQAEREGWTGLDLSGLGLEELPDEIGKLTQLKKLDVGSKVDTETYQIYSNHLKVLPESLKQLTGLEWLSLSNNELETLPEWLGRLTRLRHLNIGYTQLANLPEWLGRLTGLQDLDISNNRLTTLPEWLDRLAGLQCLDIGNNQLVTIPESLARLTELKKLCIRNNQRVTLPESLARLTGLQNLDLGNNQLITLPEWLSRLTELQSLDIGSNQLTALPGWLARLTELQSLDIGSNQLTALPEWLGRLTGLQRLYISYNRLTTLPESLARLTGLQWLYVRNNQLTALPESLGRLTGLQLLDLGNNQLTTLPESLARLTELQSLYINNNRLSTLPESLTQLTGLQWLDIHENQLTALPESLGRLTRLQWLDIHENRLTALPESLARLTELQSLDVHENRLTALPESLGRLTRLQYLYINHNQLTTLPESLTRLTELQWLDIRNNQLLSLPKSLGQLTELRELHLDNNRLTTFPESLGRLTGLQGLHLSNNQLITLPESLGRLTGLQRLHISYNRLTTLPESLGRLTGLQSLYIKDNQLTTLPEWLGQLSNLQKLNLSNNRLTTLPSNLDQWNELEYLDLTDNPIPLPPEILERVYNPNAIIQAWKEFLAEPKQFLNEIKLVLVGQESVGKTSLVNRLIHNEFDPQENKTAGIAIHRWPLIIPHLNSEFQVRINIWDFGGQEIMQATHQFFLTKRTLYLLVIDARQSEADNRLDYWLKIINSFGGDSPILLIGNKCDQHSLDLDSRSLMLKYPRVEKVLGTSCANRQGIQELREAIIEQITTLTHVFDPLPVTWLHVKEQLETLDADSISYDNYVERCQAAGIINAESQEILLDLLHDLGIVLHFPGPRLEMSNILNPVWVIEGIYKILNHEELFEKHGVFTLGLLHGILDPQRYPQGKLALIVELMEKFELCFPLEEKDSYLVPDLLPKAECDTGDWTESLAFQVHYSVLPGSVITRLIVRMYRLIQNQTVWRSGVLLESDGNEALVKADLAADRIYIWVRGPVQGRRELLAQIRGTLDGIHARLTGLEVAEKIPIPGYPNLPPVDYQGLRELERRGRTEITPEGLIDPIRIRELLDGVDPAGDFRQLFTPLQQLDDGELDSLCLNYLPEVVHKFSRGLRLDEKIDLIVDHCRRNPEALERVKKGLK